jgi:hypothetical protein
VECSSDPAIANETICQITRLTNDVALSVGFTILKQQPEFFIQILQFKEGSNNKYHPVGINIEVKGCETLVDANSALFKVLEYVLPNYKKQFKDVLHSCPYYPGRIEILNMTIPDSYYTTSFFRGNMKAITKIFNSKNQILFELILYTFNG